MNNITHTFTYDLPDDYLGLTNTLGKVATWTYTGPDKIWIFLDNETNKISGHYLTEDENGSEVPVPLDKYRVEIDAITDPLIPVLLGAGKIPDYATLEQYTETLPCGNLYTRPLDTPPDHTYEILDFIYDQVNGEFIKPYPWKQPHTTWDTIRSWRTSMLEGSDHKELPDMPSSVVDAWATYRQELRDLPQTYGASNGADIPPIDPWKVYPPTTPTQ